MRQTRQLERRSRHRIPRSSGEDAKHRRRRLALQGRAEQRSADKALRTGTASDRPFQSPQCGKPASLNDGAGTASQGRQEKTLNTGGGDWPSKGVPNSVLLTKPFAPVQLLTALSNLLNAANPP